jgi:diguanylate cyclase (GGDEF)-like protein
MLARAQELTREAQTGTVIDPSGIVEIIEEGTLQGWPEVVSAAMYANVIRTWEVGGDEHLEAIAGVLERVEADGDPAGIANMFALRARALSSADDPVSSLAADQDLARATVLAERGDGDRVQLRRAHVNCARGYGQRDLWELQGKHHQAAIAIRAAGDGDARAWSTTEWNRAEAELNWICALRELGDEEAVEHRAELAAEALRIAEASPMPDSWRAELRAFSALLGVIGPTVEGADPQDVPADGGYAGHVHLARALSAPDRAQAFRDAMTAVATIDAQACARAHSLALCVAAEIEAAMFGRETAGLRYARHLARLRWTARLSSLASMESMLAAERLRGNHEHLSRQAQLDELTGLANRRGLGEYLVGLAAERVEVAALLLVDVDEFKAINDTHGHRVGDQALVQFAAALMAAIRPGDLAIRLGGDEFALVIPSIDTDAARCRAEAILADLAATRWEQISAGLRVSASIGLAVGDPGEFEALTERADSALYRAKAAGRNQVSHE